MLDGVLVDNEVVDEAKRWKKDCLIFKVNFEKAYDSISWDFMYYIMGSWKISLRFKINFKIFFILF